MINFTNSHELKFGERVTIRKPWYSRYYRLIVENRQWQQQSKEPIKLAKFAYKELLPLDDFHEAIWGTRLYTEEIHELAEYIGLVYDDYVED